MAMDNLRQNVGDGDPQKGNEAAHGADGVSKAGGANSIDLFCNESLLHHIGANLDRFARLPPTNRGLIRAAVAITIVDARHDPNVYGLPFLESSAGHAAIVLTKRASKLRNHAGQWALPGGRMESGESAEETILRELEEEVGLRLGIDRVVGRLDDYSTRSGFTITPVVVWAGPDTQLTANREEVASIHRIPLAEFMREDAPVLRKIPESEHPVLLMPVGDTWIAAPTAAMIYQFREVAIFGNERRVAHYDQPYFAWR
jgi:8-oxo-dGTP pyrophosphatase MutT (NUDIX family)